MKLHSPTFGIDSLFSLPIALALAESLSHSLSLQWLLLFCPEPHTVSYLREKNIMMEILFPVCTDYITAHLPIDPYWRISYCPYK